MRARLMRGLKWALILVVGFVAVVALSLPVQQYLFYRRAKQLLADMQAIESHKSTWADAQALMRRWGRYGNYSGSCTAESCRYSIAINDPIDWLFDHTPERFRDSLFTPKFVNLTQRLGCRGGYLAGRFIVQHDFVVRSGVYAMVDVSDDGGGYPILVSAYSVDHVAQHIDRTSPSRFPLINHPLYSANRPGACETCMAAWIDYSWRTPQALVKQLSDINVDCFRVGASCTRIEEVLPASAPFHFYDGEFNEPPRDPAIEKIDTPPLGSCDVPVWERARDADRIVAARGLHVGSSGDGNDPVEQDQVAITEVLKGASPKVGTKTSVLPWSWGSRGGETRERIGAGQQVILMDFDNDPRKPSDESWSTMELDRCSVVADTPETRDEIAKGMAMNDPLRGPELGHSIWGF